MGDQGLVLDDQRQVGGEQHAPHLGAIGAVCTANIQRIVEDSNGFVNIWSIPGFHVE